MKNYAYNDFGNLIAMKTLNSGPQLMGNEVLSHSLSPETNAIAETSNPGHLASSLSLSPETKAITETSNSEVNAIAEISNSGHLASSHALNSETNAITETSNPGSQLMGNEVLSHALNSETNAIVETLNSSNASPGDLIGWRDTPITEIDIRSFNPFRFSSEYHDDELSLIYYNYRHYDPATGRFLSRDPIEEQGGINLYNFLENDGLNNIDIYGLAWYNPFSWPGVSHAITVMDWTVGYGAGALNTLFRDFNPFSDEEIDILGSCGSNVFPDRIGLPSGWWGKCCREHDRCYGNKPCKNKQGNPDTSAHKKLCDQTLICCVRRSAPRIKNQRIDGGISNRMADRLNNWIKKTFKREFQKAYNRAQKERSGNLIGGSFK